MSPDSRWESMLVGDSKAIQQLRSEIARVAREDTSVLIHGATGTGKSLVAEAIHKASSRADKPWQVFPSQPVGRKSGASTGFDAELKEALAAAQDGTLFIKEVGGLPVALQDILWRTVRGRSGPDGSVENRQAETRVVAATSQELELLVDAGQFHKDLWSGWATARIHVPSLRERKDDILPLAEKFLDIWNADNPKARKRLGLPEADTTRVKQWPWPENVRQLGQVIALAAARATDEALTFRTIEDAYDTSMLGSTGQRTKSRSVAEGLSEVQRRLSAAVGDSNDPRKVLQELRNALSATFGETYSTGEGMLELDKKTRDCQRLLIRFLKDRTLGRAAADALQSFPETHLVALLSTGDIAPSLKQAFLDAGGRPPQPRSTSASRLPDPQGHTSVARSAPAPTAPDMGEPRLQPPVLPDPENRDDPLSPEPGLPPAPEMPVQPAAAGSAKKDNDGTQGRAAADALQQALEKDRPRPPQPPGATASNLPDPQGDTSVARNVLAPTGGGLAESQPAPRPVSETGDPPPPPGPGSSPAPEPPDQPAAARPVGPPAAPPGGMEAQGDEAMRLLGVTARQANDFSAELARAGDAVREDVEGMLAAAKKRTLDPDRTQTQVVGVVVSRSDLEHPVGWNPAIAEVARALLYLVTVKQGVPISVLPIVLDRASDEKASPPDGSTFKDPYSLAIPQHRAVCGKFHQKPHSLRDTVALFVAIGREALPGWFWETQRNRIVPWLVFPGNPKDRGGGLHVWVSNAMRWIGVLRYSRRDAAIADTLSYALAPLRLEQLNSLRIGEGQTDPERKLIYRSLRDLLSVAWDTDANRIASRLRKRRARRWFLVFLVAATVIGAWALPKVASSFDFGCSYTALWRGVVNQRISLGEAADLLERKFVSTRTWPDVGTVPVRAVVGEIDPPEGATQLVARDLLDVELLPANDVAGQDFVDEVTVTYLVGRGPPNDPAVKLAAIKIEDVKVSATGNSAFELRSKTIGGGIKEEAFVLENNKWRLASSGENCIPPKQSGARLGCYQISRQITRFLHLVWYESWEVEPIDTFMVLPSNFLGRDFKNRVRGIDPEAPTAAGGGSGPLPNPAAANQRHGRSVPFTLTVGMCADHWRLSRLVGLISTGAGSGNERTDFVLPSRTTFVTDEVKVKEELRQRIRELVGQLPGVDVVKSATELISGCSKGPWNTHRDLIGKARSHDLDGFLIVHTETEAASVGLARPGTKN